MCWTDGAEYRLSSQLRRLFVLQAGSEGVIYRQPECSVSPQTISAGGTHGTDDRMDDSEIKR